MDPNQFQIIVFAILLLIHIVKMIIYQYVKNLDSDVYALSIIIIIVSFMLFISLILLILKTRFNQKGKKNRVLKQSLNVFLIISSILMILIFFYYIYYATSQSNKLFYLIELVLTDVWICFIFNLIILNYGRFNNILYKFGHVGLIKQIIYIVLDIETIVLQCCIIVYYIYNETIKQFILIRLNLSLNILFTIYITHYQIKQVFKLFGMNNMRFYKYAFVFRFNLILLIYAFIISFVYQFKEDLDKLLIFYLYTSLRLFNLAQYGDLKFKKLLDQQIQVEQQLNSIFLGSGNIQIKCQICEVQFNQQDKIIFHSNDEFLYHKDCFQIKENQIDHLVNDYQHHFQCQVQVERQQISKTNRFIIVVINVIMVANNIIVFYLQHHNIFKKVQFSLIIINYGLLPSIWIQRKRLKKFYISLMLLIYVLQFETFSNLFNSNYDQIEQKIYNIILYFSVVITQATTLTNYMLIQRPLSQVSTLINKHILNFFRTQTIYLLIFQIYFLFTMFYQYSMFQLQIIPFSYFAIYVIYWDIHEIVYLKTRKIQLPYFYKFHSQGSQIFLIISCLNYIFFYSLIDEEIQQLPSFVQQYFLIFLGSTVITYRILLFPSQNNDKNQTEEIVKSTDIHVQLLLGYNLQDLLKCSICRKIQSPNQKFYLLNCNHAFDQNCFKNLHSVLMEKCIVCIDQQIGRKYIQVILQ